MWQKEMHRRFELEKTWDNTTGNARCRQEKISESEFQA
jgi:hypothetical protein